MVNTRNVHPDFAGMEIFNVGSTPLDNWIGKKVYFKRDLDSNPHDHENEHIIKLPTGECVQRKTRWNDEKEDFIYYEEAEIYEVGSIQKLFDNSYGLRIFKDGVTNDFGRPARVEDVLLVSEVEKP